MKRTFEIIISFLLFSAGFTTHAQQTSAPAINAFSAKQAVDYALKNAIPVKNALLDIEQQKQSNRQITASALPQITGNASVIDYLSIPTSLIPAEFFGGTPGTYQPIKFGTKYNATYGGDLQQIIFDGQVFVGLKARKTSIDFFSKIAEITQEKIKENVYKIYYQLVVGQRQIGTVNANIGSTEKLLHDTKEMFKNGFSERLDVDKAQVQLNNLYTQRLKAQSQIDAGMAGLKFLLNMPQKDSLILTDTLSDEELKSGILDESYNYEDRKEYQLLGLQTKLEQFNVKRYQLSKIPALTFDANIAKNAQRTTFDFFKGGQPYYTTSFISFKLSIPIFDGGARNAKIASARLDLMKTQNSVDSLKSSIDNDVLQSRINMKSSILTIDIQKKNVELAEQVYKTTNLKYEQGLGSNQEISQAQADLVTAQNNYYSSLYDAIIAKIDYLEAAGKL
ncbi:MAG TPA: TolC family protein [Ginsengibacter sp.]